MYHVSVNIRIIDKSTRNCCVAGQNIAGHVRYDVTSTYQWCQLVRKNKDIIEAGLGCNESGFPMANCKVIKTRFSVFPSFSLRYISFTLKVIVDELSRSIQFSLYITFKVRL